MTDEVRKKMCHMLMTKRGLVGEDLLMPKVYVVNGHPYWFLNAAKRAAYKTPYAIEVINIEEAYEVHTGKKWNPIEKGKVAWGVNQTGETYNGFLFSDGNVKPEEVRTIA